MKKKNMLAQPFLKWAGGKRQLISQIKECLPKNYTSYYEPFVGGGALLFELQPQKAVVNDYNSDLINCYECIKNNVNELIIELKKYVDKNNSDDFYKIRSVDRTDEYSGWTKIQKAARLIYLNKTCYNGLFRLNSSGQFNSPFGSYKNPMICNEYVLKAVNKYFNENDVTFKCGDFYDACCDAPAKSLIYLDPPYDQFDNQVNFVGYTEAGFNKDDQKRLKKLCDKLIKNDCYVVISNSNTPFIRDLFGNNSNYEVKIVNAKRSINSIAKKRGEIEEVLIIGKFNNKK